MSNEYQVLSERIYSDFPVFGSCIRQRAALALSKDKSPQAVKILAEAVVRSGDRKVITIALESLRNLRDRDSVNAFCQVWAESRHKDLTTILKNRRYVSSEPKILVLSALKIGALDGVKKRGEEVLEHLLSAFDDKDTQIASAASTCIAELTNRKTKDFLCKRWIENQSPRLQAIIKQGNYEPIDASTKALFYFLLGEWQKYEDIDFDQSLLAKAYHASSEEVKAQISEKSRIAGRIEFIKILNNTKRDFDVEKMTDKDWEIFVDILGVQPDRREIWRFLCNAPPIWSKKLLDKLSKSSCKWFRHDEEVIVKNLFILSAKSKEEDFMLIPYLLIQESQHKTLVERDKNLTVPFQWKLYFTPDSSILCGLCHTSKEIWLWSLPDGNFLKILENNNLDYRAENHFRPSTGALSGNLAISPNSKILVSSATNPSRNGEIDLWGLPTGNHIRTLKVKLPSCVRSQNVGFRLINIAISPDGKTLASRSCFKSSFSCFKSSFSSNDYKQEEETQKEILKESHIDIWSLPTGDYIRSIPISFKPFAVDNVLNYAVTDVERRSELFFQQFSMITSPDNRFVVSGSGYGNISFWNLSNGKQTIFKEALKNPEFNSEQTLFRDIKPFSSNGRILAVGYLSNMLNSLDFYLWSFPDGSQLKKISNCIDIAISHDSRILVSAYKGEHTNDSIKIWDLTNSSLMKTLAVDKLNTHSLQISRNNQILVALTRYKKKDHLCLWSLPDGNLLKTISNFEFVSAQISPDGNTLVGITYDSGIELWKLPQIDQNSSISKFSNQEIAEISMNASKFHAEESLHSTLKFTVALAQLRQQFDIDIEDSSNDISSSEYDIEIE